MVDVNIAARERVSYMEKEKGKREKNWLIVRW
jgi:hypothetical protein